MDSTDEVETFSGVVVKDQRALRFDGGEGELRLSTEDMLLLTEWPRTDVEPSVSDEIVDRGRGMNSMLSEKPTRGREIGLTSADVAAVVKGSAGVPAEADANAVCALGVSISTNGVVGRLMLVRSSSTVGGCIMRLTSWCERAPDLLCE